MFIKIQREKYMNIQECDILNNLCRHPYINQRILAEASGHSLGIVNRSIKILMQEGYLDDEVRLTKKAEEEFRKKAPKNAIILAAGFGMRMIPINRETSKGLLEVNGEPLIERLIRQLHEAGITKIYIVVGFMKEYYEYLIDLYDVQLIVNPEYASKNNLHSLKRALPYLSNSYVVPCDIWCDRNPFSSHELYSWYMVSDLVEDDSTVRVNRKRELVSVAEARGGNGMIGIAYLLEEEAAAVRERILELAKDARCDGSFWEEALFRKDRMIVAAKVVSALGVAEIDTYEQLRELDGSSQNLRSDAILLIEKILQAERDEVTGITVLKKGMTNRSFLFKCRGRKYIMRIPGEGTGKLINRAEEAAVYQKIRKSDLCDRVIYLDPESGYKISEYMENARVCDPFCPADVQICMKKLREFHEKKWSVEHVFDLFERIEFYESLWQGAPSVYKDYAETKAHVLSLKPYIDSHAEPFALTHVDAVPDNFLFIPGENGEEELHLIDWEYAGMQDPHLDIAMFCVYAMYDRLHAEALIDAYFPEGCPRDVRMKIYCYIAACGLLWSNWCEYKLRLGVEFGEYSLRQYRYAKDYYRIVRKEWEEGPNGI
jgi:CTP:phosphocholine cytidylyltransferase-like protein/thiamine kinase-like enzyme